MHNYTDLKAVLMEKSPRRTDIGINRPAGAWLALGHMDWIQINSIPGIEVDGGGICLNQVKAYTHELSTKGAEAFIYRQPLYILQEFPQVWRESVDRFWNMSSAFMTITRCYSDSQRQQNFEVAVERQLQRYSDSERSRIFSAQDVPEGPLGHNVVYLCYRTFELSDVILVAKSDSAESLLACVGRLYTLPEVRDLYSYYCIGWNELGPVKGLAVEDDCISLISTRFAVHRSRKCRAQLEVLQTVFSQRNTPAPAFLVTGMEDINLIAANKNSVQMCELFQYMLSIGDDFWEAFDSSTTRLGILEVSLPLWSAEEEYGSLKGELVEAYQHLKESFFLQIGTHQLEQDWVHPLSELISLLSHLCRNCVLWQVCYILLDGIRGIIRLVEEWSLGSARLGERNEQEVMRMIRGVDRLIEHIIRMEGELVHHPETRPMLFDVPTNLLEFYLIFSDQCILYLQNREGQNRQRGFQLLLIPNLCQQISIHDQLNSERSENRLLYVEIPLGMLYDPSHVICVLVHEMAHHSGEKARNRKSRFLDLATCAAFILADELDMGKNDTVVRRVKTLIKQIYPVDKRDYIRDIIHYLLETMDVIGQTESYVEEFWNLYLDRLDASPAERMAWLNQHTADYHHKRGERLHKQLEKLLWEVEYLFKETYADLAMFTLLGLEAKDYIIMLEKSEGAQSTEDQISYACKIERAALVLCAIDPKNLLGLSYCANAEHPLAIDIQQYCQILLNESADVGLLPVKGDDCGYHSLEVAGTILHYLHTCCDSIQYYDSLNQNRQAKLEIQQNFREYAVKQRFASIDFFHTIEEYRPRIIRRRE